MTHIVLLGGGYTSLFAYRSLLRRYEKRQIKSGALKITLVSDRSHHYFHGFTGEVLSGFFQANSILTPLETLFPLAEIRRGTVSSVSPFTKSLKFVSQETGSKEEIAFDELVVGCGTVDRTSSIPGMDQFGWSIKAPNGLEKIIGQIDARLSESEKTSFEISVIGSGFTAVEIATNLSEYLQKKGRADRQASGIPKVVLYSKEDSLLKEWQPKHRSLVRYAEKMLRFWNVEVRNESSIERVVEEGIFESNGILRPSIVVPALGQKILPIQGLRHLSVNGNEKIETDRTLRAQGCNSIWAGGDVAQVKKPFAQNQLCPPNALWAIMQGSRIGKNIRRVLHGREARTFRFPGLGQAASFGSGKGASIVYGIRFTGWIASVIRMGFFLYFFPNLKRLISINAASWFAKPDRSAEVPPQKTVEA